MVNDELSMDKFDIYSNRNLYNVFRRFIVYCVSIVSMLSLQSCCRQDGVWPAAAQRRINRALLMPLLIFTLVLFSDTARAYATGLPSSNKSPIAVLAARTLLD